MPKQNEPIQIPLAVNLETRAPLTATQGSATDVAELLSYILNGYIQSGNNSNIKYVNRRTGYDAVESTNSIATEVKGLLYITELNEIVIIYEEFSSSNTYLQYNGVTYNLGASSSVSTYDMTYIESGGNYYIFIVGAVTSTSGTAGYAWIFEPSTTTLTQLVTGTHGFPNTTEYMARGAVSLDTYAFVLTTSGKIYNSNVGDVTTWTSTDFIDTDDAEDQKVYICKHHDNIAVMGTNKITFYYDAGNPSGSPLAIRKDLTIPLGLHSHKSDSASTTLPQTLGVASNDRYIAFVSATPSSNYVSTTRNKESIYIIDNFKVRKISTPTIENILHNYSPPVSLLLHNAQGKNYIMLTGTSHSLSLIRGLHCNLVYDIEEDFWYIWTIGDGAGGRCKYASGDYIIDYGALTTGFVYKSTLGYLQDDYQSLGLSEFTFTIQTPQINLETSNNKFCRDTTLVGDYSNDAQEVSIRWTDDNYQNFSTTRYFDLNTYHKLTRCGKFRKRAWKIERNSSNTGTVGHIRLSHIEINVDGALVNTGD